MSYISFVIICALLSATDARAMHIAEGILPFDWAAVWFAVALPFVAWGLYRLKKRSADDLSFKPLVGLMAAVVFIISCMPIPVPFAGTCSHPCGTGISGILVGPAISIVITAVALLLQALFLAHGGLSTWGADIVSMGVMGSVAGYAAFRILRSMNVSLWFSGFMAGMLADWATYFTTSIELAAGIKGDAAFLPLFGKILIAFVPTQLPLGILEGAMTAGMVVLLFRKRPDLLIKMGVIKAGKMVTGKDSVMALVICFFITGIVLSAPVSADASSWKGVDETVIEKVANEHGRGSKPLFIDLEDQGDLPLFLFLIAGVVGGFGAGYAWRMLVAEKAAASQTEKAKEGLSETRPATEKRR